MPDTVSVRPETILILDFGSQYAQLIARRVREAGAFSLLVAPSTPLETLQECFLERSLGEATAGERYQFERLGYFCVDQDSGPEALVFNRTVTLRDQWARMQKK